MKYKILSTIKYTRLKYHTIILIDNITLTREIVEPRTCTTRKGNNVRRK